MPDETRIIEPSGLDQLLHALTDRGFRVLGPTVREGAIVYDDLESAAQLPIGWTDEQSPGRYRLVRRDDDARFGYAVGPHSWKQFLLPPRIRLWSARRRNGGLEVTQEPTDDTPLALIGVRACELHGIAIQDRVLLEGQHVDRDYAARRKRCVRRRRQLLRAGRHVLLRLDGDGPEGRGGIRPRVDRDPRRTAPFPRRDRHREGCRRTGRRPERDGARARPAGRRGRSCRSCGEDGDGSSTRRISGACSRGISSTNAGTTSPNGA